MAAAELQVDISLIYRHDNREIPTVAPVFFVIFEKLNEYLKAFIKFPSRPKVIAEIAKDAGSAASATSLWEVEDYNYSTKL